jgi:hypothetical protein
MKTPPLIHALLVMVTQGEALQYTLMFASMGEWATVASILWAMSSLFYIGVDKPSKKDWQRAQRFTRVKTRYPY